MITLIDEVGNKRAKILAYFLINPTKRVHLRALSRTLHISLPWIIKTTKQFTKSNHLVAEKRGVETELHANKDTEQFKALKRAYTLYQLNASGLAPYLKDTYGNPEAIILFGSASRGEDTEESDIDIAIITKKEPALALEPYQKKLNRNIKITHLESRRIAKEFLTTLANGIVLFGYLELP